MPTILEVDRLVKKFGDHEAVKGVSFSVEEGEVFGLLGPNGAGKTTVISMLTGVLEPTAGTARIAGHDIRTDLAAVKKVNGLVPQDLALYPTLSARANLAFFGRTYGLRGRELKERVEDVDPQSRNHIFESVMRLNRERQMSIVYTSHYMEEVELLCNRVAIIDHGEIIALDTIKNLIALLGGGIIQVGLAHVDDALLADMAVLPAVREAELMPLPVAPPPVPGEDGGDREGEPLPATPVVKVVAEHSQQAIVSVISFLNERDLVLTSLQILEPNLESVFLHLTGKKLRE